MGSLLSGFIYAANGAGPAAAVLLKLPPSSCHQQARANLCNASTQRRQRWDAMVLAISCPTVAACDMCMLGLPTLLGHDQTKQYFKKNYNACHVNPNWL